MKRFISFILPLCLVIGAASCKKEGKEESNVLRYEMEDIVIPMTFDTFTNKDDVIIDSPKDTSRMSVRKSYLNDVLQKEIIDSLTYLAVWLAPDQYPFYRLVTGSETDESDEYIHLKVSRADVSNCLGEGEYKLCTSVFVNPAETPRYSSTGKINPDFYYEEATGEYHPVAMFVDVPDPDLESIGELPLPLKFGDGSAILVEDMVRTKGGIDPSINMKLEVKDKFIPDTSIVKIGLERFIMDTGVQLHLAIDVGVRIASKEVWIFTVYYPVPTLDEFKVVADAHFDADMKLIAKAKIEGDLPDKFKDFPLFTFANLNMVFFVGPVPVVIDCCPQLIIGCDMYGSAGAGFYAEGKVESALEAGGYYENGWNKVWKHECNTEFDCGLEVAGDVEASIGLFVKIPVKIDKLVGPYVQVGPRVEGEAHGRGALSLVDGEAKGEFEAKAAVSVGGEFGAEIKFMSWNIAKWTVRFDAWKYEFLDFKYPSDN